MDIEQRIRRHTQTPPEELERMRRAIDSLRDPLFEQADEAYRRLREDPEAWRQELDERALWEATLLDGLEEDATS